MEEQRDQQIIAYLNNELSATEKAAFELAIAADKALAEEVELYGDLYDVHEAMGEDAAWKNTIQSANDAYFKQTTVTANPIIKEKTAAAPNFRILKWGLSVAAGFLLLLAVGVWWANRNYGDEALVVQFHAPLLDNIQADTPLEKDLLKAGETYFFNGDFESAKSSFALIQSENGQAYYKAQFLLAFANFRTGDYAASIQGFNQILSEHFELLPIAYQNEDKIRWTRLLAYLGNGQFEDALFQEELAYFLNGKSEIYRNQAKTIQEKLNSPWRKFTF